MTHKGYQHVLHIRDRFTNYNELIPPKWATAMETFEQFELITIYLHNKNVIFVFHIYVKTPSPAKCEMNFTHVFSWNFDS